MIKVCHVTSVHQAMDARIFKKECISLTKEYDVYLVASNAENKDINDVHVRGAHLPQNRLKRMLSLTRIEPILIDIDADVYHFHDPELIPIGIKMKKHGKKIIFDSHEDTPMLIHMKKYIPSALRGIISKLYSLYEKKSLAKYDAIVSVTPHIVDRLHKINKRTYQITNYPIIKNLADDNRKWERKICFTGLLSSNWMLHNIIDAIENIDVAFEIAGFGKSENYLDYLKEKKGWKKVIFRGMLDHDNVSALQLSSTVGMAVETYDNPNGGYKMGSLGCTKILEYMSAGIPVIVSNTDIWGHIVAKYNCGISVEPDDIPAIAGAIEFYIKNPAIAKEQGDNAKKAILEEFNWATQESVLLNMYSDILA